MKVIAALVLAASCVWGFPQILPRLPLLDGRIVGGRDVSIEDYPYQVSIQLLGSHSCGGIIISSNWIISAAHCHRNFPLLLWYSVRVGSSTHDSGGMSYSIDNWIDHPSFTDFLNGYDISLLQLPFPLRLRPGISTIALPAQDEDVPYGSLAVVTGWGQTALGGPLADQLQAVEVPLLTNKECGCAYGGQLGHFISGTNSKLCAGFVGVGERDACGGDSGGPLVWNGIAGGVLSWGVGCARPFYPGIYTPIAQVRDWITEVSGI